MESTATRLGVGFILLVPTFLMLPRGYDLAGLYVLLVGATVLLRRSWPHGSLRSVHSSIDTWGPLALWGFTALIIGVVNREAGHTLEQAVPFLVAPILWVGLRAMAFSIRQLMLAIAVGGIASGVLAIAQSLAGISRANGFFSNHIAYGFLSVLFSGLAAVYLHEVCRARRTAPKWERMLLILGLCGGWTGALLSLTRGSWLSGLGALVLLPLLHPGQAFGMRLRELFWIGRATLLAIAAGVVISVMVSGTLRDNPLVARVVDSAYALTDRSESLPASLGVRDGSIGARMALAYEGIQVYLQSGSYWIGLNRRELLDEVSIRTAQTYGLGDGLIPQLHNEISDVLATSGVIGLLAWFCLYAGVWRRVSSRGVDTAEPLNSIQRATIFYLVLAYLLMGLSYVQFQVSSMRLTFVLLALAILTRTD